MNGKMLSLGLAVGLFGAAIALPALAQITVVVGEGGEAKVINPAPAPGAAQPGAQPGAVGQAGGEGGIRVQQMDPAKFRQQMQDQLKADLGATDDEWKVLQPKIEKLQSLQMSAMMARYGGGRRFGGNGAAQPADAAADPASELRAAVANKESTDAQLKEKLAALRAAQAKAKEELTKAQSDLRDVITVRQEAFLVSRGMLD